MSSSAVSIDVAGIPALSWGPTDGALVVALHGFPDTFHTFHLLGPRLAEEGYRVVAPAMRGIPPNRRGADADYSVPSLAGDAADVITALGGGPASVVGHDWGAVAAYALSALRPELVARLVTLAIPPPRTIARSLLSRQVLASAYIPAFNVPLLPERMLGARRGALVERIWRHWSPGWEPDVIALSHARDALEAKGAASAALAPYRALVPSLARPERARILAPIETPSLFIHGSRDRCMLPQTCARATRDFTGTLEVHVEDAGHFLHLERPSSVAQRITDFLRSAAVNHDDARA